MSNCKDHRCRNCKHDTKWIEENEYCKTYCLHYPRMCRFEEKGKDE